ncbi:MAG: hypothetical protein B6I31_04550 [Desulfobacteraceae bacterium 4572_19]|nr:MAG: hypothetical protein B6I31_04550 [Desulfobacteraceae bacterium 4572_19]
MVVRQYLNCNKFGWDKKMFTQTVKEISKEIFIIIFIAVITAFMVNTFSPEGIAYFGDWDVEKGVISAKQKGVELDHGIEINSTEQAKVFFDNPDVLFIDVRSSDLYYEGHIKGAISMPLYSFDELFGEFIEKYPPSKLIVTYCSGRECSDSHEAAQFLRDAGFVNVAVYIDGFPEWEKEAMPVE